MICFNILLHTFLIVNESSFLSNFLNKSILDENGTKFKLVKIATSILVADVIYEMFMITKYVDDIFEMLFAVFVVLSLTSFINEQ